MQFKTLRFKCHLHIVYSSRKADKRIQFGNHSQDTERFHHPPQNASCLW